jgi:hypothetical protein
MKINRANEALINAAYVREHLSYDPETGIVTWIKLTHKKSNKKVGQVAGGTHDRGYNFVTLKKRRYFMHRVIWLYMTGKWPENHIDHADRITDNNRWRNLRSATIAENGQNMKLPSDNTSGHKGIRKHGNRYQVRLRAFGIDTPFQSYATLEEAVDARRCLKQQMHTFHPIDA